MSAELRAGFHGGFRGGSRIPPAFGGRKPQSRMPAWVLATALCLSMSLLPLSTPPLAAQVTMRNMSFGTILPGISRSIDPLSPNSAQWRYPALVTLILGASFTLPTSLARSGGGPSLPISFCSTCAIYRIGTNNPSGGTYFNPNSGVSGLSINLLTTIYFWLGATVNPSPTQQAGSYSGTITLTVTIL